MDDLAILRLYKACLARCDQPAEVRSLIADAADHYGVTYDEVAWAVADHTAE